jgi:hypothetical protein
LLAALAAVGGVGRGFGASTPAAVLSQLAGSATGAAIGAVGLQVGTPARLEAADLVRPAVALAGAGLLVAGTARQVALDAGRAATELCPLAEAAAAVLPLIALLAGRAIARARGGAVIARFAGAAGRDAPIAAADLPVRTGRDTGDRIRVAPLAGGTVEAARASPATAADGGPAERRASVDAGAIDAGFARAAAIDADPAATLLPLWTLGHDDAERQVAALAGGDRLARAAAAFFAALTGVDAQSVIATLAGPTEVAAVPVLAAGAVGGGTQVPALAVRTAFAALAAGRPAGIADALLARLTARPAFPILAPLAGALARGRATTVGLALPAWLAGIDAGTRLFVAALTRARALRDASACLRTHHTMANATRSAGILAGVRLLVARLATKAPVDTPAALATVAAADMARPAGIDALVLRRVAPLATQTRERFTRCRSRLADAGFAGLAAAETAAVLARLAGGTGGARIGLGTRRAAPAGNRRDQTADDGAQDLTA